MRSSKITILHLQPFLNVSCGITKMIETISKYPSANYRHIVFSFGGDKVSFLSQNGCKVYVKSPIRFQLFNFVSSLLFIRRLIKFEEIKILHSHHRFFDLMSIFLSPKSIMTVDSKVSRLKYFSYKSDIIIAVSKSIKKHLTNYFNISERKIKLVNNFFNPDDFLVSVERDMCRNNINIKKNEIVIGFIGRINISEKGIDVLLEAFKSISHSYSNLKLLVVGNGKDVQYLDDFLAENSLPIVRLAQQVNIANYINIIDILIVPSRIEPFGLIAINGGYFKLPVIASNTGGLSEIIDDNTNGLLFEVGNSEELVSKIKYLIESPLTAKELGEKLFEKVINNFTAEVGIPQYQKVYQELLTQTQINRGI